MAGITNYGELKAAIADEMLRGDMTARIPSFVRRAHDEIAKWLDAGVVLDGLVEDADTNVVLTALPNAYLYGALSRGFVFARDYDAAQLNEAAFQTELRSLANSTLALPDGLSGQHTPSTP